MSVLTGNPTSLALTWEPHPDVAALFSKWAEEHRTGGPDPLYWSDLEPALPMPGPALGSDAPLPTPTAEAPS